MFKLFKLMFATHFIITISYLLLSTFSNYEFNYLNYYNRVIFPQGWSMFAPNPNDTYLQLYYKCPGSGSSRILNSSIEFEEKIFNKSRLNFIVYEIIKMIYFKEKRIQTNKMKPKDYYVYDSAREILSSILNKSCMTTGIDIEKFEYQILDKNFNEK